MSSALKFPEARFRNKTCFFLGRIPPQTEVDIIIFSLCNQEIKVANV